MVTLSPSHTITLRVEVPASQLATSTVVAAVAVAEAVRTEAERHWLSAPAARGEM